MNTTWKNICSLVAVLATGVVSADQVTKGSGKKPMQRMERGNEVSADQMGSGYNQPAMIQTTGEWDWFLQASFTYWNTNQEGMDLGVTRVTPVGSAGRHIVYQDSKYKPGFKVATGFDTHFDDWAFSAEYTWFHHKNHQTKSYSGTTTINLEPWVNQTDSHATRVASKWNFDLDVFDVALSRPYYQGTRLTVTPVVGLRAMWLDQTLHLHASGIPASGTARVTEATARYSSNSWAVGPRVGAATNWMLGSGFRAIGNAYAGALYTRYTNMKDHQDLISTGEGPVKVSNGTRNWIRPQVEMNLGLGWGSYIYDQEYHIDFSATYDFMVYFNQNMMRWVADREATFSGGSAGNLYLQGLTLSGRFDF